MKTFIDLFCGIGGFHYALKDLGLTGVFASDINAKCRETYSLNHKLDPEGDITQIKTQDIPCHDILCAGFPCQAFSIAGKKKGFEDTRGTLFFEIARILRDKSPTAFILENVKNLVVHDSGRTLSVILACLEDLGYKVSFKIMTASDFGVPQNRERIIIVGHKKVLFDFNKLSYFKSEPLESIIDLSVSRLWLDPSEYTLLENPKSQKSGLIFTGYRNKEIRKVGVRENTLHLSRVHKQPNRIYSAKGYHPTLSSQESSGRYFFEIEGKVGKLTIQECYALMGFPPEHLRVPALSEAYKQIGNSVCVPMVREIASQLLSQSKTLG